MEKKIFDFAISNLPNERLFNFVKVVDNKFEHMSIPQFSMVYNNYHTAVQDFQLKLEPVHYVEYTRVISEKDQTRDKGYSALHLVVVAYTHSPIAAEALAATMLKSVFDKYKGLQEQDYNQESGSLFNFIEELETHHQQEISTLHLTEWVNYLKTKNQEFAAVYDNRNVQEREYFSFKEVKAARQEVLNRYHELIDCFEAAIVMGIVGNYQEIVQAINEQIEREIITLNVAKGRKQAKKEKENGENTGNTNEGGEENNGEENGGDNGGENTNTDPNQGEDNTPSANA